MNENDILFYENDFNHAKSALDDFGLILTGQYVSFPEPKTTIAEIPFSDHAITLGMADDVYYKQRKLRLNFELPGSMAETHLRASELANYLHGKNMRVVDTNDITYYYCGRLVVDRTKTGDAPVQITITGVMDPYKYEINSSVQDWQWDIFCFDDGILREYRDLQVQDSLKLVIPGRRKKVVPVITASAPMSVTFSGRSYPLLAGENKLYEIMLGEGEHELIFTGKGNVSVDYRGGSL